MGNPDATAAPRCQSRTTFSFSCIAIVQSIILVLFCNESCELHFAHHSPQGLHSALSYALILFRLRAFIEHCRTRLVSVASKSSQRMVVRANACRPPQGHYSALLHALSSDRLWACASHRHMRYFSSASRLSSRIFIFVTNHPPQGILSAPLRAQSLRHLGDLQFPRCALSLLQGVVE